MNATHVKERAETSVSALDDAALTAARLLVRGVNVIPRKPSDKRPAMSWERFQGEPLIERDTDLDRWVLSWWAGTGYGVGAVTGAAAGIAVVDVDDAAGAELLEQTCTMPRTVTVTTRKGCHYWFAHPGGRRRNRATIGGVGLDVRADGGFVVCPPSVHESGHVYSWEVSPWEFADGMWPPAPMPPELVELIWPTPVSAPRRSVERSRPASSSRYVQAALTDETAKIATAPDGGRNDQLNRSTFALARFVSSGDLAAVALVEACVDAARRAGLSEREAERTVESALKGALV